MPKFTVLHPFAGEEVTEAYRWYCRRSAKAATRFLMEFDEAIKKIAEQPQSFPEYLTQTRRCLLKQFPYLIIFREFDREVLVVAVAHGRRRPGYWMTRT